MGGVLRAAAGGVDERAFHVGAEHARSAGFSHRRTNVFEGASDGGHGAGHGGGEERGDAGGRLMARDVWDGGFIVVHGVKAHRAVDMDIDKTRRDKGVVRVDPFHESVAVVGGEFGFGDDALNVFVIKKRVLIEHAKFAPGVGNNQFAAEDRFHDRSSS